MNRKIVCVLIITFFITTSCKKNDVNSNESKFEVESNSDSNSEIASNIDLTKISFNKVEHDFGTINSGDKVDCVFTFTNTGNADLIITNAQGSCGCTVPEYPKKPTKPGESGEIKVVFNSNGKFGNQEKSVSLTVNTENKIEILKIKASIKE